MSTLAASLTMVAVLVAAHRVTPRVVRRPVPDVPARSWRPRRPRRRRRVATVAAAMAAAAVWPPLALGMLVVPRLLGVLRRRATRRRARDELVRQLPDAAELAVVAAGAGLTVPLVVAELAARLGPPLGPRFAEIRRRAAAGELLADALAREASADADLRPLAAALVTSDRYGSPLIPALDQVAADARRQRRHAAELAARRLPVQLLFPLVSCILPAFVLLGLVPALGTALGGLRLP